jgi:hypothetical protein
MPIQITNYDFIYRIDKNSGYRKKESCQKSIVSSSYALFFSPSLTSSSSKPVSFFTGSTRGEGKVHSLFLRLHFACVSEQKFYFFENLIRDHKKTAREKSET